MASVFQQGSLLVGLLLVWFCWHRTLLRLFRVGRNFGYLRILNRYRLLRLRRVPCDELLFKLQLGGLLRIRKLRYLMFIHLFCGHLGTTVYVPLFRKFYVELRRLFGTLEVLRDMICNFLIMTLRIFSARRSLFLIHDRQDILELQGSLKCFTDGLLLLVQCF